MRIEDNLPAERWGDMDAFLARQYRPNYVLRQRPLFEWQFHDPERPGSCRVLCAYESNQLVGMLGCIVIDVLWGDPERPRVGTWTANWMVAPEHRHGTGWLLMRRAQELFPVILDQRANQANQRVAAKMGFQFFDDLPRFVAVLDAVGMQPLICPGSSASARAALAAGLGAWPSPAGNVAGWAQLEAYRPDWRLYPALHFGTLRSAQYLRWRYLEHPVFEYGLSLAGSMQRPAVCVYRHERTTGAAAVTVGRIVELFAPSDGEGERDARLALGAALAALAQRGAVFADFHCSSGAVGQLAERLGMLRLEHGVLASRLNPIEFEADPQNLQFWAATSEPTSELGPSRLDDLYVTRSDGDQDRPNT